MFVDLFFETAFFYPGVLLEKPRNATKYSVSVIGLATETQIRDLWIDN
jgi:hypothetical protein